MSSTPATILCVEDHADSLVVLQSLLGSYGYKVITAASVSEALLKASSNWYDVLVSDIHLGDGTGHELLLRLRQTKTFPAIAVTGLCFESEMREHFEAGFDKVIKKPYDHHVLRETIALLCKERTVQPARHRAIMISLSDLLGQNCERVNLRGKLIAKLQCK